MLARQMLFEQDAVNKQNRTLIYRDEFPNFDMILFLESLGITFLFP